MRGEYSTKQREAILAFLCDNSTHSTASEIHKHLRDSGISVGVATIYRTLDRLERDGIVRKMSTGDGKSACYQYIENAKCHEHFHLKCTGCGALIHLDCHFLEEMEAHILGEHGFQISSGRTVIYGLCQSCTKK
ncbi:MAG: transcriptional repressor [Clostridia bacterium]|nr:transcriptional repressor [Clostridia bacterium]